jgi:CheY-like chemotaxis protein
MEFDLSAYSVIIIDDEAPYRKFIKALLGKKLKMEVFEAENPLIAFEIMKTKTLSLILLDMEMPAMDGLTALRNIRQLPGYQDVPVIVCSALRVPELIIKLAKMRITDYIAKPSNPATIITKVLKAIAPHYLEPNSDNGSKDE